VRRLTPAQARYIRTFYGEQMLHQLEALERRGAPHDGAHHAPHHAPRHGPHHPPHDALLAGD
jgi:hypothetical protein